MYMFHEEERKLRRTTTSPSFERRTLMSHFSDVVAQSWDRKSWVLPTEKVPSPATTGPHESKNLQGPHNVRVVLWPEGAPPQEDVPHAGTKVRRSASRGISYVPGKVFTVTTGIPYKYQDHRWYVRVTVEGGNTIAVPLEDLEVASTEPERTYTEDEVRTAVVMMVSAKGTNDILDCLRSLPK